MGEGQKGVIIVMLAAISILLLVMVVNSMFGSNVECKVPSNLKVTYDKAELEDQRLAGTYWACNGLICNRYLTPDEWANKNCYVQQATTVCNIRTQQGTYVVPIANINVTSILECAEYVCLQEVLVRNASYIIPVQ